MITGLNDACRLLADIRMQRGASDDHFNPTVIRSRLMGIVSELGEAYNETRPEKEGSIDRLALELADVFIRWGGLVGFLELDIEQAISEKIRRTTLGGGRE
jgi:NTP pyrophosphatase (non-canonical NTP hydrolase)